MIYNNATNSTSLDDKYSDLAIIDTLFPGILVPDRVWGNFVTKFMGNNSNLICNQTDTIFGVSYPYCFLNSTCGKKENLYDIWFYFNSSNKNGNTTQYMLPFKNDKYAVEEKVSYLDAQNVTQSYDICKILVYGQGKTAEDRYLLGNAFLKSFYVVLDYTNQMIGFNGEYKNVVNPTPKPDTPPGK